MENIKEKFRSEVFSSFRQLANDNPQFEDAQMLVGSSEAQASLKRRIVHKSVDSEWIDVIEEALPSLDTVVRMPTVAIENVDEILPVELSRHVNEQSVKHLAQHTNLIQKIEGDEVTPSKLLNVYHEETWLTYENKFVNTLLHRLFAFVDKRYKVLKGGSGTEQNYLFDYETDFKHIDEENSATNVKFNLNIDLNTPLNDGISDADRENNVKFERDIARIERIYNTILAYLGSEFSKKLGKNYIRPPVIRTNAILKNKNMSVCLGLWEYIEGCEKVGYSMLLDEYSEMPSDDYVRDFYSSVALQYLQFYDGVMKDSASNRLLSEKRINDVQPDFDGAYEYENLDDYDLFETEYRKDVRMTHKIDYFKKYSEHEKLMRSAILKALKEDEIIEQNRIAALERERLEKERIAREEEQRRLALENAERERMLAEEAEKERLRQLQLEKEAKEAEAARLALEAAMLAELEAERRRLAEQKRLEDEARRREYELRRLGLVFADDDENYEGKGTRIPYTRAEYLALPRKVKKKVLTDVRKMHEEIELAEREKQRRIINGLSIEEDTEVAENGKNWEEVSLWEESVKRNKR